MARVLLMALVAGVVSLVVMAPEAVAQVCAGGLPGGGGGGGIPGLPGGLPDVPTLSTVISALLVAAVAGLGGWSLRRSGRGLGATLAVGLLALLGVPANVRARVFSGARPQDAGRAPRRRARVARESWRRPGRARRVGLVVLASSLLAVLLAPSPARASHASGWSSISVEEGWDYNQPSWWTEWELDWESRRGLDVQCGPTSGGDGWGCTAHRPHQFLWTGYAEAPDGSGKGWEQLSMELLSHWNPNYSGIWSWEATAWVDCFGTGSSSNYCSYPDNSVHPFNWRMNSPTTPPQSKWKYHETVWGGNDFFAVDIGGNYYHSGTQYFLGDGVDPRNYRFLVDDLGTWPDIVTNKENIPPVLTLGAPNNQDLHRCGTPEFDQAFTVSATDAEGHNWTAHVQVWDPDGVRIVNETTAKTASGNSVSTAAVKLTKNGTYTWSATPKDTSGRTGYDTGSTASGSFDFIFNLPPVVPTLVAPTSDDPDNPALVLDTQAPTFVIETTDPEEDDYEGLVQVQKVDDPLALPIEAQTTQAKSGTQAVAQLDAPLASGSYQWRAGATDVLASGTPEWSGWSDPEPFEVVRSVTNSAPAAPTLVGPDGGSFAHGADQTFTINADDADGDDYLGVVTVTDTGTGEETSFTTETAASGADSSGSPATPLAAGSYTWTASAVDTRGASGPDSSPAKTFTVAAPPPNLAPVTTLVSPAEGATLAHNDMQVFTVRGVDAESDAYQAEVEVDGEVICETVLTPSAQNASCIPVSKVGPGLHTWRARSVDVHGNVGDYSLTTRTLTVLANRAPGAPSLVEPDDGHVFPVGAPQMLGVRATDDDDDSYHAEVTVKRGTTTVATVETAPAPSDFNSYGVVDPPLEPGTYTWSAVAVDVAGNRSEASAVRTFTVNSAPNPPALVAPAAGHTFAPGDDQSFTVTATDPNGHPYRASVTIRQADTGVPVLTLSSPEVASGGSATVTTPVDLPPGDYTWSAKASDGFGGTSVSSPARGFNVAGDLDNRPPDAPVLVSPGDNSEHPYGDPDRFVVRATDPNDDPYTATITVRNATTNAVVATIEAGPAASGVETSGRPPDFLPIGSYEWSARATDLRGESGDESATGSFTVVAADP